MVNKPFLEPIIKNVNKRKSNAKIKTPVLLNRFLFLLVTLNDIGHVGAIEGRTHIVGTSDVAIDSVTTFGSLKLLMDIVFGSI